MQLDYFGLGNGAAPPRHGSLSLGSLREGEWPLPAGTNQAGLAPSKPRYPAARTGAWGGDLSFELLEAHILYEERLSLWQQS